jgi:diguanylate cyclase (GGDEF)-like protein
MKDSTAEAIAVVDTDSSVRDEPERDGSPWRLRSFRNHSMSDEQLAALSGPVIAAAVGGVCVVLGLSVVWRGDVSNTAAGFWPPAGVTLVAMILLPPRRWAWVVVGIVAPAVVAIVFWNAPIASALWWFVGNSVEPAFGAYVLHQFVSSRWMTRGRLMLVFFVSAVVVAPMIGGAIGSIGTVVGYGGPWLPAWRDWVLGDGLGILVVVPLLISYTARGRVRRTRGETVALGAVVIAATALAFADIGTNGAALLPYLILVGLIWAGMRFGTSAAATAGFVLGLGANVATSQGFGPFSARHGSVDAVTLQIFLAIALITSFVVAAMASDLADRDEVNRILTEHATHDELTGLPNRVLFVQRLDAALQTRRRTGLSIGLLLINLDDFKKINDRYGHSIGDATLAGVAERLRRAVRRGDLLARLGGDEFVVLCADIADSQHLLSIADAMTHSLARSMDVGGSAYQLTGSVGVALVVGDDPIASMDVLHRADIALQHAKRSAGIDISLFDDALEAHTRRRVEIVEELLGAIDRDELTVMYQPVVCLATGRVSEFEALIRWNNRRFGPVTPAEFIPIAEESGLITRIGDFVLDTACSQVASWRSGVGDVHEPLARVSVNASARQVCDLAFPNRVRRILKAVALPADALTLEITETAVMDDLDASAKVLAELRQIGVKLALDDFGTGYSSMTHLRRMPVNTLKIDCSFVAGLGEVAEDTAIVESIISLGHSFGVKVVAEGIETVWQLQHLVRLGCDDGQGFLWSRAVDALSAGALMHDSFYVPELELELEFAPRVVLT